MWSARSAARADRSAPRATFRASDREVRNGSSLARRIHQCSSCLLTPSLDGPEPLRGSRRESMTGSRVPRTSPGQDLPHVPARVLRGELRDQSVDAERVRPLTGKPLIVKPCASQRDRRPGGGAGGSAGGRRRRIVDQYGPRHGARSRHRPSLARRQTRRSTQPAVRAVALAQVYAVAGAVSIPIVGMGGVQRAADALDLVRAGASLVRGGHSRLPRPRLWQSDRSRFD